METTSGREDTDIFFLHRLPSKLNGLEFFCLFSQLTYKIAFVLGRNPPSLGRRPVKTGQQEQNYKCIRVSTIYTVLTLAGQ